MDSDDDGPHVSAYSCRHCGSVALGEQSQQCCGAEMESIAVEAVSEPDLMMLLPQVFAITQTGIDIVVHLMAQDRTTTDDIATALEVNRATVTRQLNQLRELGVVERREEPLEGGGRIHLYSPVPIEEMRRRHREGLLSWATEAITLLDEIGEQKLKAASEYDPEREHY